MAMVQGMATAAGMATVADGAFKEEARREKK
jgi:hypothetical protein